MHYKCHKLNLSRSGSHVDSPDGIKDKKAAINPINKKDDTYFQYALTDTLNHEKKKKKHRQVITKLKSLINKYNWEEIKFLSEKDDSKKFEKNNRAIALNVLYARKEK